MFKNITTKLRKMSTLSSLERPERESIGSTSSLYIEKVRTKYYNKNKKKLIERITLETGCDDIPNSPKNKPSNVCFIQDSPYYIHRVKCLLNNFYNLKVYIVSILFKGCII